ncbi:SDR family oxidoreductase [Psychromarinibacter sp. C21-152]|uniref:3-dehydrosphinganine reductase n=1 Tax=Psychromarinibacter sediminicola TaxID=3033385 RepID=A0AAE3NMG4_9RHOB|nr:SDR family oxidoreductase [Psychromarinibacter sediminicola]MDF0600028.1 SDR family oxidoreductase [Psychromarinibacter sediminicola]
MSGAATRPAFITGGSSGIGLELARQLAARGHPVAVFARDPGRLRRAVEILPELSTYECDVGDAPAVEAAVGRAIAELGPPGWAIANAGVAEPGLFLEQPAVTHETHMRVNYMGALHFARACAPAMPDGARLVFVSSGAAFFGIYGYGAYAPSKFALRGLAEVLRVELAPRGISVTLAYPPDTETPMLAAEARTKSEATRKITAGGGVWQPADVARLILKRAERGRFAVAPGAQMTALLWLHSLLAPALRRWQAGIVRRSGR